MDECLHKQKPTWTTWGKPPQSAIWEKMISLINTFLAQSEMNIIHFIHSFNKCITKSCTFSSVVLVGFNLELHSTWNIKGRLLLNSKKRNTCKCFSKLLRLLRWCNSPQPPQQVMCHQPPAMQGTYMGERWAVNFLTAVRDMFVCVFFVSEPTLVCWLCPHSDLQLASRSPGPDG